MMRPPQTPACPLCACEELDAYFEDKKRVYLRCRSCRLVHVPERYWLSHQDEKAIYDFHQNSPQDAGYRQFLSRLSVPLLTKLKPQQQGLDFGCGPGPTLSVLLEEQGHQVDLYDPYYRDDRTVFAKRYDFVCATEVVEHLQCPGDEFTTLFGLLRPGGWLAVMTKLVEDLNAFGQWQYIRDMTHICFYCEDTFHYISWRFDAELQFFDNNVVLLRDSGLYRSTR
jgi:2-polyprenyl-3-methyl-5-hydroxy-6-metoxy-1,4-benzoquinol methylase